MSLETYTLLTVLGGFGVYLLGRGLIDAYFWRKEKFVDTLNEKLRSGPNGTSE